MGRELFTHRWTEHDPLTEGDGLGPVFNASSCVECHSQAGPGGGGPIAKNVTVYGLVSLIPKGFPSRGLCIRRPSTPHSRKRSARFIRACLHQPSIPLSVLTDRSRSAVSAKWSSHERNTPALFGDGLIDAISDDAIIAHQREHSTAATAGRS